MTRHALIRLVRFEFTPPKTPCSILFKSLHKLGNHLIDLVKLSITDLIGKPKRETLISGAENELKRNVVLLAMKPGIDL